VAGPVEAAWSVMKNGLGNLAAGTVSQLVTAMRHQLHRIQRQHSLSSPDSSARPDSPSSQNPPDTQTLAFQAR
jgi:hypothetical protein